MYSIGERAVSHKGTRTRPKVKLHPSSLRLDLHFNATPV